MRNPRERPHDILEAIRYIDRYAVRGREAFEADELLQRWSVRHLQIIGEAARAVPDEVRAKMPECGTFWFTTTSKSTTFLVRTVCPCLRATLVIEISCATKLGQLWHGSDSRGLGK